VSDAPGYVVHGYMVTVAMHGTEVTGDNRLKPKKADCNLQSAFFVSQIFVQLWQVSLLLHNLPNYL